MLPLPEQYTLDYTQVHWELERWTLFNSLPNLVKFDGQIRNLIKQISTGHIKVPDYLNEVNPPTLWTYYETLPSWARNDPHVRNVMMAAEYHQTGLDIRAKEQALNFACSFLRPIDNSFKKVLTEACMSNKVQLNMKLGQRMLTEL